MSTDVRAAAEIAATPARHSPIGRLVAAAATAGAGAIHLAVVPEHLREYVLFGLFFAVVGAAQLVAAVAVLRRLRLVTAAAQSALVLLWLVSRTTGLPIGPTPWTPEEIGTPDVVCVALGSRPAGA